MPKFHTIGIIAKQGETAKTLAAVLRLTTYLRQGGYRVLFSPLAATLASEASDLTLAPSDMGQHCDLAITVGGDGTLLGAARALASAGVPLLGINLGRLGFLADLSADVVIHKWNTARMLELETRIDGVFVNRQRSDGVIVSTPTGSTAYALSGGGPLLHPALDAIALVPICPHTLSNRPLVVAGSSRIEIRADSQFELGHVIVTCDGQSNVFLTTESRVLIERAPHPIRLLHPKGHDHYDILRAKLGWGGHPMATAREPLDPSTC